MRIYGNGGCERCTIIGCDKLQPVRHEDKRKPIIMMECVNPRTGNCFEKCPKGISESQRN